jgi:GTPase SAR1 family protein
MPHDQAYILAEKKIEEALKSGATNLDFSYVLSPKLTVLPESIGQLTKLRYLNLTNNQLKLLPESICQLSELLSLNVSNNELEKLPDCIGNIISLRELILLNNQLRSLPHSIGQLQSLESLNLSLNLLQDLPESLGDLTNLEALNLTGNHLTRIPESIGNLKKLKELAFSSNNLVDLPGSLIQLNSFDKIVETHRLDLGNQFNSELAAAYKNGINSLKSYLRAKATAQITLNEAKLILIGEGEVGKTCLTDALLSTRWAEHQSTHGIQIRPIKLIVPESQKEIILNSWDFGGQRVYRPTHQLFFSAPAVYLVVWKPREGSQQGFVKEWIQLVKRREPSAKIIVVATHGGPKQRQPDIDREELWDLFGKDTVIGFFFVDSKPDKRGKRTGIEELKQAIASVAAKLPEVGRSVPKSFVDVRAALQRRGAPYLPFDEVLAVCQAHNMDDEIARLFITISHRLGRLTHYENDPTLRNIVILRPDWLATAMSYVLDDEQTRSAHGLVNFSRLSCLWQDPARPVESRYPPVLHPIFLRLMERFDLSYRVADPSGKSDSDPLSLIGQLVPDIRPINMEFAWLPLPSAGDIQQTQVCRIVDKQTGQRATAEGLFYQLIVRLHKYSLGRVNYKDSVHWQRGLVLDNSYNGRAFLEHKGDDIHITVRAPYPERFLTMLTEEVKYLVESFWEGLRCEVMVPCVAPCGKNKPGTNLFEVEKLIAFKRKGLKQFPCTNSGCDVLQDIDQLLLNSPAATQPISLDILIKEFAQVKDKLDVVNDNTRRILSQVDKQYADLIQIFTDEAKEGPRLFSLFPLDSNHFNPKSWFRHQFRLVLWCEHSRLPLPVLNNGDMKKGVYDLELEQEWFKKAAPYLKLVTSTLSLVLPVASSALKVVNDTAFKSLQNQIDFGEEVIDAIAGEGSAINKYIGKADKSDMDDGVGIRAEGATLRELQALLKAKDPGFGGLIRVINKRQEFLWVHEKYASEY